MSGWASRGTQVVRPNERIVQDKGIIALIVDMGTLQVRTWFGVIENSAVAVFICIKYIDRLIKVVFPLDATIAPMHSAVILSLGRNGVLFGISSVGSQMSSIVNTQEYATVRVIKTVNSPIRARFYWDCNSFLRWTHDHWMHTDGQENEQGYTYT